MYSQTKIQETIEAFAVSEGWTPTPHSLGEVNEFKSYIDSLVDIESNSKNSYISIKDGVTISNKRQKEITRWIENEQALCAIDCGYFESRYVYLRNERGIITKFQNRKSQEILDLIVAELEDRDLPIELLVRGSRQTGITTKVVLKFLHRALFTTNATITFASLRFQKNEYIKEMAYEIYGNLPWWLVPSRLPKNVFINKSMTHFASGMQATRFAQGWTPQCIYLSNVEDLPDPRETIENGLLRAVHSTRDTFLAIHASKFGKSSWVDSIWHSAKEYYPQGMFRLCPVFIPWFLCTDMYPHADWLRIHPIPSEWEPLDETRQYVNRCESYMRNTPLLSKLIGVDWKMPTDQQWFWEMQHQEAKIRNNVEGFMEAFSLDDDEAVGETEAENSEVDFDKLFPSPVPMQEKVGEIRRDIRRKKDKQ